MKKFRVVINTCPTGHLRYGHYIGTVEAESEEELRRKLLSEDSDEVLDFLDFVLDDYEVEDASPEAYDLEHAEIAEITDKLEAPEPPAERHPIKSEAMKKSFVDAELTRPRITLEEQQKETLIKALTETASELFEVSGKLFEHAGGNS